MKRKIKRYDGEDGSLVEDESDRGSMTADQQANSDATNAAAKTAEPQSFKEAFAKGRADALAGGSKTFTWNGKSYTTELASNKPAAKTVTSKAESSTPKPEYKAESSTPKPEYKTEFQRQQEAAGEGADAFGRVLNKVGDKIRSSVTPNKTQIKKTSTNPNVPTPEEAAANRKEAAETIGKVASGIGSYLKDTFTPSGRMAVEKRREANKATPGFKKGGMASSRGDGIAQRGHTKGRYM